MNVRTTTAVALFWSSLALLAPQAFAQTGFYVGGNVGVTNSSSDNEEVNGALRSLGFTNASTTSDTSGTGFKGYGGYAFTPNVAIEFGYFDLGKITADSTVSPPGTAHFDLKFKGFNVDVVGSLPVGSGFSLFGRVGLIHAEEKANVSSTGSIVTVRPSETYSKTSRKAGLGVEYMITGGLGVRAEGEIYNVPDGPDNTGNISLFSVGLLYRF